MASSLRGARSSLVLLLVMLPMGLLILPTTLLVLAGMVPTIVAYIVDRNDDKAASMTVGSINLCGIMPFLIQLWQHGHNLGYSLGLLSQPVTWLVMYSAAGMGWVLYFAIPPVIAGWSASRDEGRVRQLESKREALVEVWGPEVAEALKAPPDTAGEEEDARLMPPDHEDAPETAAP